MLKPFRFVDYVMSYQLIHNHDIYTYFVCINNDWSHTWNFGPQPENRDKLIIICASLIWVYFCLVIVLMRPYIHTPTWLEYNVIAISSSRLSKKFYTFSLVPWYLIEVYLIFGYTYINAKLWCKNLHSYSCTRDFKSTKKTCHKSDSNLVFMNIVHDQMNKNRNIIDDYTIGFAEAQGEWIGLSHQTYE